VAAHDRVGTGASLLEAARQYDANRGASFTTYAGIRIRGAMLDEVRRNDWVPRSVHRNARKISETIHQLENEMGQSASDHEIAKRLDISLSEYHAMLLDSVGSQLCALEDIEGFAETYAEGLSNEVIEPCEDLVQNKFQQALAEAIEKLPEREKMIVALYYDEELNLKEIGKVLNITESRVSQINSQAMARLRSYLLDWL